MSNYYNEYYEQNNYTNTYSLWENSRYYDINNLSPHNRNSSLFGVRQNEEFHATKWPEPNGDETSEPPEHRNRRVIERESLYEDPDTFYKDQTPPSNTPDYSQNPNQTPSWTELYWQKSTDKTTGAGQGPSHIGQYGIANNVQQFGANAMQFGGNGKQYGSHVKPIGNTNRIHKKQDLARPVKMAKAESMMEKMGWHGGALGKSGNGIVEPVAANAIYTKTRIGFGLTHSVPKPPAPKNKRVDCKQYFDMNALLHIYEFVQNNNELELVFDRTLRKDERKSIHHLVKDLLNADDLAMVNFNSNDQMDLVLQICDKNCYILCTQSHGEPPNRRLSVFKEAPYHVYLVIPDDLRFEETDEETKKEDKTEEKRYTKSLQYFIKKMESEMKNSQPDTKMSVSYPKNSGLEPKKSGLDPKKSGLDPKVSGLNPKMSGLDPKKSGLGPKKSGLVPKKSESDTELEEESNPFLRSITRNLKKSKSDSESEKNVNTDPELESPAIVEPSPNAAKISARIVEYFQEFAERQRFTEMKFLGPFNDEEVSIINEFIDKAVDYLNNKTEDDPVFGKVAFQITEDSTGNTVIMKRPQ